MDLAAETEISQDSVFAHDQMTSNGRFTIHTTTWKLRQFFEAGVLLVEFSQKLQGLSDVKHFEGAQ